VTVGGRYLASQSCPSGSVVTPVTTGDVASKSTVSSVKVARTARRDISFGRWGHTLAVVVVFALCADVDPSFFLGADMEWVLEARGKCVGNGVESGEGTPVAGFSFAFSIGRKPHFSTIAA
jgi:hypothetical protein